MRVDWQQLNAMSEEQLEELFREVCAQPHEKRDWTLRQAIVDRLQSVRRYADYRWMASQIPHVLARYHDGEVTA